MYAMEINTSCFNPNHLWQILLQTPIRQNIFNCQLRWLDHQVQVKTRIQTRQAIRKRITEVIAVISIL